jgi:hypothetical protein
MSANHSSSHPAGGFTRRQFIYSAALAAGATALSGCAGARPRRVSANDKLNIAAVGIGGKGASDTAYCAGENIVALCDVDERMAAKVRAQFPKAAFYRDYRQMFEREKSLDAVIVATPDHSHALIAATAMRLGKHVYCQKPLTYSVYEARCCATWRGNPASPRRWATRAARRTVCAAGLK